MATRAADWNCFPGGCFLKADDMEEHEMSGTSKPEDPRPEPDVPGPLPELPELDPVPEDGTPADHKGPAPDDVPYVPPPGTQ